METELTKQDILDLFEKQSKSFDERLKEIQLVFDNRMKKSQLDFDKRLGNWREPGANL